MNAPLFVAPVRVREPGLNALPPGTERYPVKAGGSVAALIERTEHPQRVLVGLGVGKLDGKQKRLPAGVVGFPFYDPTRSRVRDVPPPE